MTDKITKIEEFYLYLFHTLILDAVLKIFLFL